MKYFRMSEWDIKWNMTWDNYMLYVSSIPKYKSSEPVNNIETKDATELF